MAKRNADLTFERKLLTMTQDEKRKAQRQRLMEQGLLKRKQMGKQGKK